MRERRASLSPGRWLRLHRLRRLLLPRLHHIRRLLLPRRRRSLGPRPLAPAATMGPHVAAAPMGWVEIRHRQKVQPSCRLRLMGC